MMSDQEGCDQNSKETTTEARETRSEWEQRLRARLRQIWAHRGPPGYVDPQHYASLDGLAGRSSSQDRLYLPQD